MADILILLLGVAALANITAETLVEAARDKFTLRKSCEWERLTDGSYHHTMEDASLRRAFDHKWSLPRPGLSDQMNAAIGQAWQPKILAGTAFTTADQSSMAPSAAHHNKSPAETIGVIKPVSEPSQPECFHTL